MWAVVGWTDAHQYLRNNSTDDIEHIQYLTTEEFLSNQHSADINKFLLLSSFFHCTPEEQRRRISKYKATIQKLVSEHSQADIIYLSSASVYGLTEDASKRFSEDAPTRPLDRNGYEKVEIENLLLTLANTHQNINLVIIRSSGFFGKRKCFKNSRNFIDTLLEKKLDSFSAPIRVSHNGQQVRDFLYVFDLINILNLIITSWPSCFSRNEPNIINIATTEKYCIHDIVSLTSVNQADILYTPTDKLSIHNALNTDRFQKYFPEYKLTNVEDYILDCS